MGHATTRYSATWDHLRPVTRSPTAWLLAIIARDLAVDRSCVVASRLLAAGAVAALLRRRSAAARRTSRQQGTPASSRSSARSTGFRSRGQVIIQLCSACRTCSPGSLLALDRGAHGGGLPGCCRNGCRTSVAKVEPDRPVFGQQVNLRERDPSPGRKQSRALRSAWCLPSRFGEYHVRTLRVVMFSLCDMKVPTIRIASVVNDLDDGSRSRNRCGTRTT